MKQRLRALEKKSAEEGIVFTEAQVQALERKKHDDLAYGEIETHHPGYLGNQDTFYIGTINGVGRIYRQTPPRRPSPEQICSTAVLCLSSLHRKRVLSAS